MDEFEDKRAQRDALPTSSLGTEHYPRHAMLQPLERYTVQEETPGGLKDGDRATGVLSLTYALNNSEYSITLPTRDDDEVDFYTDEDSLFVLTMNSLRQTISITVLVGGQQVDQAEYQSDSHEQGQDICALSPDERLSIVLPLLSPTPFIFDQTLDRQQRSLAKDETRVQIEELLRPETEESERAHTVLTRGLIRAWSAQELVGLVDPRPMTEDTAPNRSEIRPEVSTDTHVNQVTPLNLATVVADQERHEPQSMQQPERQRLHSQEEPHSKPILAPEPPQNQHDGSKIYTEPWSGEDVVNRHGGDLTLGRGDGATQHDVLTPSGNGGMLDSYTSDNNISVVRTNPRLQSVGLEASTRTVKPSAVFKQGEEIQSILGDDAQKVELHDSVERLGHQLPMPRNGPVGQPETSVGFSGPADNLNLKQLRAFIRLGRENLWIRQAWDPPFDERSFKVCTDRDELTALILRGNWSLGQAFVLGDICFINQVDGGDEWLTIKGSTAFESITLRDPKSSRGGTEKRFRDLVRRIQTTTEDQCARLKY